MRKLYRGIAAGLLAAPLALGLSGVASAAGYGQHESSAGPDGASASQIQAHSGARGDGGASFHQSHSSAGPEGAQSSGTHSHSGAHQHEGLLSSLL